MDQSLSGFSDEQLLQEIRRKMYGADDREFHFIAKYIHQLKDWAEHYAHTCGITTIESSSSSGPRTSMFQEERELVSNEGASLVAEDSSRRVDAQTRSESGYRVLPWDDVKIENNNPVPSNDDTVQLVRDIGKEILQKQMNSYNLECHTKNILREEGFVVKQKQLFSDRVGDAYIAFYQEIFRCDIINDYNINVNTMSSSEAEWAVIPNSDREDAQKRDSSFFPEVAVFKRTVDVEQSDGESKTMLQNYGSYVTWSRQFNYVGSFRPSYWGNALSGDAPTGHHSTPWVMLKERTTSRLIVVISVCLNDSVDDAVVESLMWDADEIHSLGFDVLLGGTFNKQPGELSRCYIGNTITIRDAPPDPRDLYDKTDYEHTYYNTKDPDKNDRIDYILRSKNIVLKEESIVKSDEEIYHARVVQKLVVEF